MVEKTKIGIWEEINRQVEADSIEREEDRRRGLARVGERRIFSLSYAECYFESARVLVEAAENGGHSLNILCVPFLQAVRHTLELALKDLVSVALIVNRTRVRLGEPKTARTLPPKDYWMKSMI